MRSDFPIARALAACGLAAVVGACAVTAPAPAPTRVSAAATEPMRVTALPAPAPAPAPAIPPPAAPTPAPTPMATLVHPIETVVAYAERVRALAAAELAQEVQRLGDSSYTPA